MIYNQVSSKRVIAKVLTDLNMHEEDHRIQDCMEWIGEAVEEIGAFSSFNIKVTGKEDLPLITIADYQAKLPADLMNIIGVKYSTSINSGYIPLRYGTGTYGHRMDDGISTTETTTAGDPTVISLAMELYGWTYEQALEEVNSDPLLKETLNTLIVTSTTSISKRDNPNISSDQYVYYINNSYIKVNFKNGYLKMAYQAMPVDEEGYPMIPDNKDFVEACYWYINMKIKYPQWAEGRIRDQVYFDAENKWLHFMNKAYGAAIMPNADKYESLVNTWNKLYPDLNEFNSDFLNTGAKQIIHNH